MDDFSSDGNKKFNVQEYSRVLGRPWQTQWAARQARALSLWKWGVTTYRREMLERTILLVPEHPFKGDDFKEG